MCLGGKGATSTTKGNYNKHIQRDIEIVENFLGNIL
jgi:hypothetical protein